MHTVQIFYWLFSFTGEESKYGTVEVRGLLASNSCIHSICAKAAESMVLEVGRGCFVLQVLKATDNASTHLALWSSTGKETAWSTFVKLEGDIGFEE